MRTVEFNTAMSGGEGAQFCRPFPRAPHPGSDSATVNVLLRHQHEGDISNEVTMGTFLTRLDTSPNLTWGVRHRNEVLVGFFFLVHCLKVCMTVRQLPISLSGAPHARLAAWTARQP